MRLTLALLLAPLAFSQTADWRFADPSAQLIGGVDVQGLVASPLFKGAMDQVTAKMGDAAPVAQMTLGALGGISQVYFSITARKDNADSLMMIKGTLDDTTAKAFLQGATQGAAAAQTAKTGPKPPQMDLARIDESTILIGTPSLLPAAVRRLQRPAPAQLNPLVARTASLAGNDLWIVGTLPDIPEIASAAAMIGGVRGLAFGLSARQDLRLLIALDLASAAVAEQMATQVRTSADDVRKTQKGPDVKIDTQVDGATLRVTLAMDGGEILKALNERLKDGLPTPGALFGGNPAPAAPKKPAAPQGPKTIRIYGLDDGPKEITVPPGQH
jgi:hypothetical protein